MAGITMFVVYFAVTVVADTIAGLLIAGILAGTLIQLFGTVTTLGVCGVLSVAAVVIFWVAHRLPPRAEPA